MPGDIQDRRNMQFDLLQQNGWSNGSDFSPFSIEGCLHTEGYIYFVDKTHVHRECWFLLEFLIETKTKLLARTAGSFTAKVALPLSGGGFEMKRFRDEIEISTSSGTIMSSDFDTFLTDFSAFQTALEEKMKYYFPKMMSSPRLRIFF